MSNSVKYWSPEQVRFMRWLALPKAERQPKQQQQLAKELDVSAETLSRWKSEPDFMDEVVHLARELVKHDVPDVLGTIRREAKRGSQYHTNVFLAMAGLETDVANAGKGNGPNSADAELASKLDRLLAAAQASSDGSAE